MKTTYSNIPPETLDRGYESLGVNIRGLIYFIIGFIITAAILHTLLWFLLLYLASNPQPNIVPNSIVSGRQPQMASPPLQPVPTHDRLPYEDLEKMYCREDSTFSALGWKVDPNTHRTIFPDALIARLAHRPPTTQGGQK